MFALSKRSKIKLFFVVFLTAFIFSIITFVLLADYFFQKEKPLVFERKQDLSRQTTGEASAKTFLFVGDIMLDRGVEELMQKYGLSYPFKNISQFLKKADIVCGNLEGPIVQKPKDFSVQSLKFAFKSDIAKLLSFFNFSLLSLANNHTLDMGEGGLQETKDFLAGEKINFFGDPINCTEKFFYQEQGLVYLGFNKTFSSVCLDEEISAAIKKIRENHQDAFIIVNVHWGEEYQKNSNSIQQQTAHQIIDAGADLIIGHHPHIVQNIESYKDKLVFYSLGNFIFDQYFSTDTQQGLAVSLEFYPARTVYRLFPIQSHFSQPSLMEEKETTIFMNALAQKSSPELAEQIKGGLIEIAKKQ